MDDPNLETSGNDRCAILLDVCVLPMSLRTVCDVGIEHRYQCTSSSHSSFVFHARKYKEF